MRSPRCAAGCLGISLGNGNWSGCDCAEKGSPENCDCPQHLFGIDYGQVCEGCARLVGDGGCENTTSEQGSELVDCMWVALDYQTKRAEARSAAMTELRDVFCANACDEAIDQHAGECRAATDALGGTK